jgi:hypothetical protein
MRERDDKNFPSWWTSYIKFQWHFYDNDDNVMNFMSQIESSSKRVASDKDTKNGENSSKFFCNDQNI